MCRAGRLRGATLIELVVTIVVVSIALAGVLLAINRMTSSSADPMAMKQAEAVADAYLEEILLKDYADPTLTGAGARDGDCGTEAGESARSDYDDVGDYAGLTDNPPRDQQGNSLSGLGAYTVSVSVTCGQSLGPGGKSVTAKTVTVTVSHSGLSTPVRVTGVRSDV